MTSWVSDLDDPDESEVIPRYVNRIAVVSSGYDFVCDFYQQVPARATHPDEGTEQHLVTRIVMSPHEARQLQHNLALAIDRYEDKYAKIPLVSELSKARNPKKRTKASDEGVEQA